MVKVKCWYSPEEVEKNTAEKIALRCCNCGKETMKDKVIMNITHTKM